MSERDMRFVGWGDEGEWVVVPGWHSRAYVILGWLENDVSEDASVLTEVFDYGLPEKVTQGFARFWHEKEHPKMSDGGVTVHKYPGWRRVPATWVDVR